MESDQQTMRVLIVSDTHGKKDNFKAVLEKIGPIDHLIHCGDIQGDPSSFELLAGCPMTCVRGNCDFLNELPREEIVAFGKYTVFVTHGHLYSVQYSEDVIAKAALEAGCNVVMYGHTHVPELRVAMTPRGLTFLNPGSLSKPRQDMHMPTFALMEIDEKGEAHYTIRALQMDGSIRPYEIR